MRILLVADVVNLGDKRAVKWLTRIKGKSVTVGGPSTYMIDSDKDLNDLLKFHAKTGDYAFNSEVPLAEFQGETLRLKVK